MDPIHDERLTAYLDGELSEEECHKLEDELATNPRLAQLMGEMRVLRDYLRTTGPEAAPRGLYGRVMGGVDADAAARRRPVLAGMGTPLMMLLLAAGFLFVMRNVVQSLESSATNLPPAAASAPSEPEAAPTPPPAPVAVAPTPPVPPTPPKPSAPEAPPPYFMAPEAYHFVGPGTLAAVKEAAAETRSQLVDKAGNPAAAPDATGELWVEIDADQVKAFRGALETRTKIDAIGMPRMIEGRVRLRLVITE